MPKVTFARHLPKEFNSPAEEILWFYENVRVDGFKLTRTKMGDILKVGRAGLDRWLGTARWRKTQRLKLTKMADPQTVTVQLARVEFGIDEPLCRE